MTSLKVKFRPSTVDGKEGCLYYQVIHRRTVRQISTDYRLFPHEWDAERERVVLPASLKTVQKDKPAKASPTAEPKRESYLCSVSERLKWDSDRIRRIIRLLEEEDDDYKADDVVTAFQQQRNGSSLFGFMRGVIEEMKQLGRRRCAETYLSALNRFRSFRDGLDLPLDGLTTEMVGRYEAYLKKRDLTMNTVSFYMRILRAVYNRAVDAGLTEQRRPFRSVYTGIEKTRKRAIPVRTLKAIRSIACHGTTELARDFFLFSFFTRGMSFVDMAFLRKTDIKNGVLTYRRRKTGQLLTIRWEPCMEEIVRRHPNKHNGYLLPIITSHDDEWRQYRNGLHLVNYHLRRIAQRLGMEQRLTMYVARHSWASAAKAKQIPISVISQGLGHDSQLTTQIYLAALEASVVDNANRQIIKLV